MSDTQIELCSLLLKEFHGDIVTKVCHYLVKNGETALKVIAQETSLTNEQTKRALAVLIQHNIVYFVVNKKRGFVEYGAHVERTHLHVRFPRFVYSAKLLFGDTAELLVEEFLQAGQVQMSKVITKVTDRIKNAYQGEKTTSGSEVKEKFSTLAETQFIQRCPSVKVEEGKKQPVPTLSIEEAEMYAVPNIDVNSRKRKRSEGESEQPSKKRKTGDEGSVADEGIFWRINYDRFHQHLRDQAIIKGIASKIDKRASEVMRTILRLSEVKTSPEAAVTVPVSCNEIFQALPKDMSMDRHVLDQYLTIMCEDSCDFLRKTGDSGGGMYVVDLKTAMTKLCLAHVESVVQERFGSKSLRIFRLLMLKKHLEQKQIEDNAMIPAKETKELLYRMFGESFVTLTEVPKTPDHAPSRTFYLFSVNLNLVARQLLEKTYKTLANLMKRRDYETRENRRLLDKQQRVEAIAAQLEQSGADPAQRQEIEEMITPPERAQLNKVKHMTDKLEQSELQLDDTMFVLQMFLIYDHMSS